MWSNLQETADLVTFTEEILNGKVHFLCTEFASDALAFDKSWKEFSFTVSNFASAIS